MNQPSLKTLLLTNHSTMSTKIKFLSHLVVLDVFALFTSCEANKDIIEESALEHHTPAVLSQKISFKQSKHFSEINSEINSIQTKFNKRQTSKENQSETGGLRILTDEVLYVTYAGTHTYTFKVVRENPMYLLENIVLHYNLRTKSYDEYLMQYKDLKEQDLKEISEGKLFQDSKKVIVTKLENGFFESHSSSNKGSSTNKASNFICNTVTSTIAVSCSELVHNGGNMAEWNNCKATIRPYAYQSSYTTCVPTYTSPTQVQETADPSSGGGGNDPNVVIYNPLPLEPCDNTNEVDLNGNCIQPIDVAVSYIANCLSSNYSTILNQSEINFLHSTTSSFEIKNYLQNNGCSSESVAFTKEMINQMRQNPIIFNSITPYLIEKKINVTQLNACLKGIMEKLKMATNSDIANVMAKLDATNEYNLTMKMGTVGIGNYAETIKISQNNYQTTVTQDTYTSASKLYRATALLHETIHAYMLSVVDDYNTYPTNAPFTDFPELFKIYVSKINHVSTALAAQHEDMANKYVDAIASALEEYQTSTTGIPSSLADKQVFLDLAWSGLQGTAVYNKKSQEGIIDDTRITARVSAEQTGSYRQGQYPVGAPCN